MCVHQAYVLYALCICYMHVTSVKLGVLVRVEEKFVTSLTVGGVVRIEEKIVTFVT